MQTKFFKFYFCLLYTCNYKTKYTKKIIFTKFIQYVYFLIQINLNKLFCSCYYIYKYFFKLFIVFKTLIFKKLKTKINTKTK